MTRQDAADLRRAPATPSKFISTLAIAAALAGAAYLLGCCS